MSDGTLRFICLATLFYSPAVENVGLLILLDEPELGLHPAAIQLLINLLSGAATRTQVIVSTQSVTLINQLKQESIIVDRKENSPHSGQITLMKNWTNGWKITVLEIYVGENIIGGRP